MDPPFRKNIPVSLEKAREADLLWMINLHVAPMSTPLWAGWNSSNFSDTSIVHKVWYLPQINQSPNTTSVVTETMNRAQRIAHECNKKYIAVTYDLAIAKVAMKIQATEMAKYDNILINLGAFHVKMAFLKVLGKFIDESGGPYILNECSVLQKGSTKVFLSGTHYNRGKRIHQLLAVTMEILHFRAFVSQCPNEYLNNTLKHEVARTIVDAPHMLTDTSNEMREILNSYREFTEHTRNGTHGQTAQYWMGYIDMVHLYHEFSRSIRTGDLQLYIHC